jgi:phage terminase large subunit-like protein
MNPGDLTDWIEKIAEREQGTSWVVEMHNAGFAAVERLRRIGVPVIEQKIGTAQGSKLQRAFVLHDLSYRRKVFIVKEGHWQEFMTQLYSFTGDPKLNEKDDLIDPVTTVTTYLKESKSKYVSDERTIPNKYLIETPSRFNQ